MAVAHEGIVSTLNVRRKTAKKLVKNARDGRRPKNNFADLFDGNGCTARKQVLCPNRELSSARTKHKTFVRDGFWENSASAQVGVRIKRARWRGRVGFR